MVNYDEDRGVTVTTSHQPGGKTRSTLNVARASAAESGTYTCKPSKIAPATIDVFVSRERGERRNQKRERKRERDRE